MLNTIPTVKVVYGDGFKLINKSDFNKDEHELYVEAPVEAPKEEDKVEAPVEAPKEEAKKEDAPKPAARRGRAANK